MCVRKSAFYSYNFHIFRLFGFGKEEGDVYRVMITMCFCHDHQRSVMYLLSYDSAVVDFLQPIIWRSLFAAVGARRVYSVEHTNYISAATALFTSKHKFKLKLQHFHISSM